MKYDVKRFQAFLQDAIGDRSQASFAEMCGISKEHLSRMLRREAPNRPSKVTLRKIADNSAAKHISYEDLLTACGYADTPAQAAALKTPEERAESNAKDMKDGFRELTARVCAYKNVQEFMDEYQMLYGTENCQYAFLKKREYEDGGRHGAEYYIPGVLWFYARAQQVKTYFVLFFCETKGGQVFVTDFAMDGQTIKDMNAVPPAAAAEIEKEGKDIRNMESVYTFSRNQEAEERLLKAIFGGDDEKYPFTEVGFGFEMESVPERFGEFVKAHKDSWCTEENEDMISWMDNEMTAEEAFREYVDEDTFCKGFAGVISTILRKETGFDFESFEDEENGHFVVMLPDGFNEDYDIAELKDVILPYVKELGIRTFGEVTCRTYRFKEKSRIFNAD